MNGYVEVRQNNIKQFLSAMNGAKAKGLETIGLLAEGYAKKLCPVDTGRLRDSITHVQSGNDEYIGTNVEYGPYVEMGTSKQVAQPYLRPAATEHASQYKSAMKSALENA